MGNKVTLVTNCGIAQRYDSVCQIHTFFNIELSNLRLRHCFTVIPELGYPWYFFHHTRVISISVGAWSSFDLKHRPTELQVNAPGGSTPGPTINATSVQTPRRILVEGLTSVVFASFSLRISLSAPALH